MTKQLDKHLWRDLIAIFLILTAVALNSGCATHVSEWQSDISCIIPSEWRDRCTPASPKLYSPERDYTAIVLRLENTLEGGEDD